MGHAQSQKLRKLKIVRVIVYLKLITNDLQTSGEQDKTEHFAE